MVLPIILRVIFMCFPFIPAHTALSFQRFSSSCKHKLSRAEKIKLKWPFLSIRAVPPLDSHMRLFIKKTSIGPIRFLCSALISLDLLHFLPSMENSREENSFPLGPTSFRATYLPVSGCQTVSEYKTQAIYFVHIRVCCGSLFTRCLFFSC